MNKRDRSNELAPVAERTISDVESLKAMSDPVRLRILEAMISAPDESWTVKRLATAMGVGPTKLYHHINVLEEREFIRVAGTRVVSGIIETSYRVAQLSVRLDRSLLASSDPGAAGSFRDVMGLVLDTVREDIDRAIRTGLIGAAAPADPTRELFTRGLTRLTPDRAAELRVRLKAVLDEYEGDDADGDPFGYLVTLYPMAEPAETTETTETMETTDD